MKKILLSIILIVLFGSIIYSSYNIMLWFKDNKKTNDLIINIKEEVYKTDVDEKLDDEQDKIDVIGSRAQIPRGEYFNVVGGFRNSRSEPVLGTYMKGVITLRKFGVFFHINH